MLAGNLDEFVLTEVLRFLSSTGKSGQLRIDAGGRTGRIELQQGQVVDASADAARLPLAARLLDAGLVEESHLVQAADDGGTEVPGWLGRSLLAQEAMDSDALQAAVADNTREAVTQLLRHQHGEFVFRVDPASDLAMPGALPVDQLVADCTERAERWAAIREHLPPDDAVLVPAPEPSDGNDIVLSLAQWRVLGLVDGRRTVAELLDLGGNDQEATCGVIADLVKAGLLVTLTDAEEDGSGLAAVLHRREVIRRLERRLTEPPRRPAVAPAPSLSAVAPPEPITLDPEMVAALAETFSGDENAELEPAETPAAVLAPSDGDDSPNLSQADAAPPPAPAPAPAPTLAAGTVDRAQAVRELAALGLAPADGSAPGAVRGASASLGEVQQRRGFGRLLGT